MVCLLVLFPLKDAVDICLSKIDLCVVYKSLLQSMMSAVDHIF